jgi:phage regulator Rha-like protein
MKELVNTNGKMTSLEIAEISKVSHGNLMKSIRKMEETWMKIGQVNFYLSSYINSQNRAMPMYELSKTECLYIATKFNDEARAKLILRWHELEVNNSPKELSTLDMLEMSIKSIRENQLGLEEVKKDILELKAQTKTSSDYYTIVGFATLNGISCGLKLASSLGKKASALCKSRNIAMEQLPDPRFGLINTYPKPVLEEVFNTALVN